MSAGREEVIAILRESLTLNVKADSHYTGGMDGGPMYRDGSTVQLLLDGEVISEASL